ncbi:hypothetical protein BUALT_Bualt03G0215400 [Buddleja alternifolia]|uniref:Uncharacterized protein n=1 Tax=Buddleja alternifolia TaxID=168488 RepID=A0AAV6XXU2_9LAMI|nr:hypothetical protein BUALT_Bualt03G0215400 [Buddleja alternifolia]
MRKRERENPCGVCGHYQKYEEGEVCGICGHHMAAVSDQSTAAYSIHSSAFPSEILPEFLYLGSYDNAARAKLLKTQGISRILNISIVPACQNLYRNSFTYHCLQDEKVLPFDDAIQFLEQCEKDRARVLVHCMSGKNRSPAIVMAYLMKSKGWKLGQSYEWVKERRPSVELNQEITGVRAKHIWFDREHQCYRHTMFSSSISPSFSFGFSKSNDRPTPLPAFSNATGTSIFSRPFDTPQEFTFGAAPTQKDDTSYNANTNITSAINDITMDGS